MDYMAKIEAIKNISAEEMDLLSPKQKEVAGYIKQDCSVKDICEKMDCSRQNVHIAINAIINPQGNGSRGSKAAHASSPHGHIQYEKYKGCDLSILSPKEKQAITIVLENPKIKHSDIANIMGISSGHVTTLLFTARKKLDGEYEPIRTKNKENTANWIRNNAERASNSYKAWYQNNAESIKNYNKEYYQKNKDRILSRKKMGEQT